MAAIIALTDRGQERALAIAALLPGQAQIYVHEHCSNTEGIFQHIRTRGFRRLRDIIPEVWSNHSLLIFIMAAGIVVREVGSLIQGKDRDPAVLVGDEAGRFLIPLLSGHLGGANAWASYLASREGSTAVITTATDVHGLIAPDEYARRFGWKVEPLENLPRVNRKLLDSDSLSFFAECVVPTGHPLRFDPHYREMPKDEADVIISAFPDFPTAKLYLIPRVLSIGIGCRRGTNVDHILEAVDEALSRVGASRSAVKGLYSIELKAGEIGLNEAADRMKVPFMTFKAKEIQAMNERAKVPRSEFVKEKIGVDGVCEAASLLGTKSGSLILPKQINKGITVAISKEGSLSSELDPVMPNI